MRPIITIQWYNYLVMMLVLAFVVGCDETAKVQQEAAAKNLGIPVEKTLPKSGIVLRLIPTGTFTMGSSKSEQDSVVESIPESAPAEARTEVRMLVAQETQHNVTLSTSFYIGRFEVTQEQWKKVMHSNPSEFKYSGDNAPVETVSWHDCTNFMAKLATLEGMPEGSFRLPTEAEWEYACRAGTQTAFCCGDDLDASRANFHGAYPHPYSESAKKGAFRATTVPVGQFKSNAWGLYDMHGNVWEWCADRYKKYDENTNNAHGAATDTRRVVRGGGLYVHAYFCRSAYRYSVIPDHVGNSYGFRLCMAVDSHHKTVTASTKNEENTNHIAARQAIKVDQEIGTAMDKVQQKAAAKLCIPVEKKLPKSDIVLRLIPAGSFLMGSPESEKHRDENDERQHKVTLTKAFYMGKHEITRGQWKKVMGSYPSESKDSGDNTPVDTVTWYDCQKFINKLIVLEDQPKSLPSGAAATARLCG